MHDRSETIDLGPDYTQVPNAILDEHMQGMTLAEMRVILYVIRRTFGAGRFSESMSIDTISTGINLSRTATVRALRSLKAQGLIVGRTNRSDRVGNEPTTYALNTPEAKASMERDARASTSGTTASKFRQYQAVPGYVYLLYSETMGYCKIGRSKNLTARVRDLGTQMPFRVDLLHSIECSDMVIGEKYLHDRFHDKRANGEWFLLEQGEIDWIKGLMEPYPWDVRP